MGHGHVRPNSRGTLARCGGPAICKVCANEAGYRTPKEWNAAYEADKAAGPWLAGMVRCEMCFHRWAEVRLVGNTEHECPRCGHKMEDRAAEDMIDGGRQ